VFARLLLLDGGQLLAAGMATVWSASLTPPNRGDANRHRVTNCDWHQRSLYERFGFMVSAEDDVIGMKNWFMTREARPPEGE